MKHKGDPGRAAVQLRLADTSDIVKARQLGYYQTGVVKAKFHLIDLPDILVAGFVGHLGRIKRLAETHNFAFAAELAAGTGSTSSQMSEPPPTLEYDMSCLQNSSSKETSMKRTFTSENRGDVIPFLQEHTMLDDGQAVALFENLSRKMAFTQGPPGTGKTFLGAAECEVILDSQDPDDRKPIIVVCMTNHALDDFIDSLIKRKIRRIARLGNRSTHDWIKPYLMRSHAQKGRLTGQEAHQSWELRQQVDGLTKQGTDWATSLSANPIGWAAIADYLRLEHPKIYNHFSAIENVNMSLLDIREIRQWSGFAFQFWIEGGDILDVDSLMEVLEQVAGSSDPPDEATVKSIEGRKKFFEEILDNATKAAKRKEFEVWSLDQEERAELLASWYKEIDTQRLCEMMAEVHRRHQEAILRRKDLRRAIDKRVIELQKIDIIGLTSTGCAQNWDLLELVQPRVVLFEESSELLEAHSLCALVPSIKHAIQIGDPLQLRPHVEQMALSTEMDNRYRLDESLFERMMSAVDYSKLHIQRRAHPDLADLLRVGDYPYLEDHPSTRSHPNVPGMVKRLYWLDHSQREDQADPRSPLAKSFSNTYEVESIAAFVKYLIEHQGYKHGKITVLTPYNGQLAALAKKFGDYCSVHLTKEDRETLEDADVLKEVFGSSNSFKENVPLASMIRVATIDNYQGEENDVVILSTVRSQGKLGFMKNRNRINVAISRAHNGFYVFGNASLMTQSDHWSRIINVFKKQEAMGTSFPVVSCSEHDGRVTMVKKPSGFKKVPHCNHICTDKFACGHLCNQLCHPQEMHTDGRVTCQEVCGRALPCGHACKDACGKNCGPCQEQLQAIKLECGHKFLPRCSTTDFRCDFKLSEKKLQCGHDKIVTCSNQGMTDICDQKCTTILPCGHMCQGDCSYCSITGEHPECTTPCGKALSCQHECATICHGGRCPPCRQQCKRSCRHGPCSMPCYVVCDPCIKSGEETGCEHHFSESSMCCLPTASLPCSEPCKLLLPCMLHICPGLCGETCPQECQECQGISNKEPMITLQCQHTFSVADLDAQFKLGKVYEIDSRGSIVSGAVRKIPPKDKLICPTCSSPAIGTRRYELSIRLGEVRDTIDRLYAKYGRQMANLMDETRRVDILLFGDIDRFLEGLPSGPLSVKNIRNQIKHRAMPVEEIQREAQRRRDEVVEPTQRFVRQFSTMLGSPELFPVPVLQFKLRYDRIFYRCRFMRVELSLRVLFHLQRANDGSSTTKILIEGLRYLIESECTATLDVLQIRITECELTSLKRLEVEFRIVQISFALVLDMLSYQHELDFNTSLARAQTVCTAYPNSAGLLGPNLNLIKAAITQKKFPTKIDDMWDSKAANLWQKWGKHKLGHLVYCQYSHPYSSDGFSCCPECGPVRTEPKEPEINYNAYLATPADFMAYFEKMSRKGTPSP